MRTREYGQFCGLARAMEVLGQRWTMLVLRDLLVAPRRYSDLLAGLPGHTDQRAGQPAQGAGGRRSRRPRGAGRVRPVGGRPGRRRGQRNSGPHSTRWRTGVPPGCGSRATGEVVTDASLVGSLRVAAEGGTPPRRRGPVTYEVRVGAAVAHATVTGGRDRRRARRASRARPGRHRWSGVPRRPRRRPRCRRGTRCRSRRAHRRRVTARRLHGHLHRALQRGRPALSAEGSSPRPDTPSLR